MPAFETMDRYQKAVLWVADGTDPYGQPTFADPVEIRVRWVNQRRQTTAPDSSVVDLDAQVVVAREVPVGSAMWLGALTSWETGTGSVGDDSEVMEVVSFERTPSIHNRFVRWMLGLRRYKDTPTNLVVS